MSTPTHCFTGRARRVSRALLLGCALLAPGFSTVSLAQVPDAQPPVAQAVNSSGVSINTADAAELARALSGVGQSKAEAIVRYREQFGPFESIEELVEVNGIGSATLERNRGNIRLD